MTKTFWLPLGHALIAITASFVGWSASAREPDSGSCIEIVNFSALPASFTPAGSDEPWVRFAEGWCVVRPHWIVGILKEGPAAKSLPGDWNPENNRVVGVIAVNLDNGQVKQLKAPGVMIASLVPLGDHRCGFTLKRKRSGAEQGEMECQIREWNLHTDQIGDARDWHPLMGPVARIVDSSRVRLLWQSGSADDPGSARVELRLGDGSSTSFPAPLKDYSLPVEMSTLWEEGQETRWYAPTDDGIGVVSFIGRRSREQEWREPYSESSTVTCYDPRANDGMRWRLALADLVGSDNREVHSVVPIYSPWMYQPTLLIECVSKGRDDDGHKKGDSVRIVQVNLRDGSIQQSADFEASERFRFLVRSWWPRCSTDQARVIYMVQDDRSHPCRLAVYSVSEQKFLDDVTCPLPFADHLLPVSQANEAIVLDQWQMSAVGIGEANYGQVREVHRLFATDSEPQAADSPQKK